MDNHLERGRLLLQQSRPELAARELRQELTNNPDDPLAHALLALCLTQQKQHAEATDEARRAVHLAPDFPFAHFVLGAVLEDQDRLTEAEAAVNEAIALEPEEADYFALLGSIRLQRRQWNAALAAADAGLTVEPEHIDAANVRAMALQKLGRRQEAGTALQSTLARDPDNAATHANQGWALLEAGKQEQAMEHFREALRLDPNLDWARQGVLEALRARYVVYRVMLGYFFWMSRLSDQARWGVIFGGLFVSRALRSAARQNPELGPFLYPLIGLYFLFVFLTWTAEPLFNLLLRLNPLGRLALSRDQIVGSNWVGASLLGAFTAGGIYLLTRADTALFAAAVFALLVIPIAGAFGSESARGRKALSVYAVCLAVLGFGGLAAMALGGEITGIILLILFVLGALFFPLVANAFALRRS